MWCERKILEFIHKQFAKQAEERLRRWGHQIFHGLDRLPMKSYFQIRLCRALALHAASLQQDGGNQVGSGPAAFGGGGLTPCCPLHRVGLLLSVSGSVLAEQIGRRWIFSRNFTCQGNKNFDYLDWVSKLRIPSYHSHGQPLRKDVLPKSLVFMWTVFIICNVLWIR